MQFIKAYWMSLLSGVVAVVAIVVAAIGMTGDTVVQQMNQRVQSARDITTLQSDPHNQETINAEKDSQQMQQAMNVRVDAEARAAGAAPIRVTLPVNGKLFRLEKILVLPGDKLFFDLKYSGWKVAK